MRWVANISGVGFPKDMSESCPLPPRPPRSSNTAAVDCPPRIPPRVPERSDNDGVLNNMKRRKKNKLSRFLQSGCQVSEAQDGKQFIVTHSWDSSFSTLAYTDVDSECVRFYSIVLI